MMRSQVLVPMSTTSKHPAVRPFRPSAARLDIEKISGGTVIETNESSANSLSQCDLAKESFRQIAGLTTSSPYDRDTSPPSPSSLSQEEHGDKEKSATALLSVLTASQHPLESPANDTLTPRAPVLRRRRHSNLFVALSRSLSERSEDDDATYTLHGGHLYNVFDDGEDGDLAAERAGARARSRTSRMRLLFRDIASEPAMNETTFEKPRLSSVTTLNRINKFAAKRNVEWAMLPTPGGSSNASSAGNVPNPFLGKMRRLDQ